MFQIKPIKSHLVLAIACLSFVQIHAQEQIGVASAVNKNTTDLTLEQERKLIDAGCLLYTSPSPRDKRQYRMPSSA